MQNGSMAGKVKVLYDGEEIEGLTRFGDVPLENGTIDVPSFNRVHKVQSGVTTMPEVQLTYETRRNTNTRKFFKNYFHKKEKKNPRQIQETVKVESQALIIFKISKN